MPSFPIPGELGALFFQGPTWDEIEAMWRSGDAADCKSVYPGSIPGVASKSHFPRIDIRKTDAVRLRLVQMSRAGFPHRRRQPFEVGAFVRAACAVAETVAGEHSRRFGEHAQAAPNCLL